MTVTVAEARSDCEQIVPTGGTLGSAQNVTVEPRASVPLAVAVLVVVVVSDFGPHVKAHVSPTSSLLLVLVSPSLKPSAGLTSTPFTGVHLSSVIETLLIARSVVPFP